MGSGSNTAHTARDGQSKAPVEMLSRHEEREHLIAIADMLAKMLDTAVRIPGTSVYIGLDPLLGLIPGIGDALANLMGTIILGLATRLRVPRIVVARMSLNLLINGTVGTVPIVGDLFSFWFRSNAKNAALLREASMKPERETQPDWFYVGGIIGGTAAILLLVIGFAVWAVAMLWAMVSS